MKVPFRVVCINGMKAGFKGWQLNELDEHAGDTVIRNGEEIYETENYTVVAVEEHFDHIYYVLAERPSEVLYHSRRFVPLSNIPEASVIGEQEKEAIVNLETV